MPTYVRRTGRKRASWHVISREFTGAVATLCGRLIDGGFERSSAAPIDEKGCETCARLALRGGA